jgi:hypothetical protein
LEENTWIFGYGLTVVACEAYQDERQEEMTTGRSVFEGGGKRSDALMKTKGFIQTLLFAEIKRHDTPLLKGAPYRHPDVFQPSAESTGCPLAGPEDSPQGSEEVGGSAPPVP